MKIIVTGSIGNISKPLAKQLISEGHVLTIVTSSSARTADVEKLGAKAAVGNLDDVDFVTSTFTGADAVYCMIPPNFNELNQNEYYRKIGEVYKQAIEKSDVKKVVFLSSWGAHRTSGTGIILGSHIVEEILKDIPADVSLVNVRPTSIMYNLHSFADMIRHAGFIGTNYGDDDFVSWVHPEDIAEAIAEVIVEKTPAGTTIVYVASDEMTASESAKIVGEAIGKPDLQWKMLPKDAVINALQQNGIQAQIANDIADLNESMHNGALAEHYLQNKPTLRNRKLKDFAKEFAAAYNNPEASHS